MLEPIAGVAMITFHEDGSGHIDTRWPGETHNKELLKKVLNNVIKSLDVDAEAKHKA